MVDSINRIFAYMVRIHKNNKQNGILGMALLMGLENMQIHNQAPAFQCTSVHSAEVHF